MRRPRRQLVSPIRPILQTLKIILIQCPDREVHQDHYHTSVQPVKDREVLPERHEHRMAGVETRHVDHGDSAAIAARLEQERAQFQDHREVREKHTDAVAPTIAGEHVHHHVHEVC